MSIQYVCMYISSALTLLTIEYMFKRLVKKVGKPKAMNFLLKCEDQEGGQYVKDALYTYIRMFGLLIM